MTLGTRVGVIIAGIFVVIGGLMIASVVTNPRPPPQQDGPSDNISNNVNAPTPEDFEKTKEGIAAAMQDPHKVQMMECMGVRVYEDPQPPGHPPSAPECALIEQLAGAPLKDHGDPDPDIQIHNKSSNSDMSIVDRAALDNYKQQRLVAMTNLHIAYFAGACGAFSDYHASYTLVVFPYFSLTEQTLGYAALQNEIGDQKLHESLTAAGQSGISNSQKPGACDYWKQHPDDILPVRQEIEAARAVAASQ